MQPPQPRPTGSQSGDLAALFERPEPALTVRLLGRPSWRETFGGRRRLVAVLVAPILWHEYAAAVGGWTGLSWPWWLGLAGVALVASLTVATYVPQPGTRVGGSPCASMAGLTVVFAGMALSGAPIQIGTLLLATGLVAYGLRQRLRGADACARR